MTDHAQTLLREALALSEEERAGLIAELLVSLEGPADDDEPAVERAWAEAVERRARRVLAGETSGEEWSLVRDRVRHALTDERRDESSSNRRRRPSSRRPHAGTRPSGPVSG